MGEANNSTLLSISLSPSSPLPVNTLVQPLMVSCQKCRQPISPSSFPNYSRPPHHHHQLNPQVEDSISSLSPSTYDLLSHSERYPPNVPPQIRPYYNTAINRKPSTSSTSSTRPTTIQRITVPPSPSYTTSTQPPPPPRLPAHLGPTESFVVLTDSVLRPPPSSSSLPSTLPSTTPHSTSSPSSEPTSLNSRLTQLAHLTTLLSSTSSIDHPLCTECADTLVQLMQSELDEGKKERDRLIVFEKETMKKREDAKRDGNELTKEGLEKDIAKVSTHSLFYSRT